MLRKDVLQASHCSALFPDYNLRRFIEKQHSNGWIKSIKTIIKKKNKAHKVQSAVSLNTDHQSRGITCVPLAAARTTWVVVRVTSQ